MITPLTREQELSAQINDWIIVDRLQRQTIDQQAQELERLQTSYDADMKH